MSEAQLVVRGGVVIDGSGRPGVAQDVAIADGRIVDIGDALRGERTIDAEGCVVAPGFIDIHTHYDAQVFWDPGLTPSCWHGVTTVVAGNCGFSLAPVRPDHRELIIETLQNVEDMPPDTLRAGVDWESFETFAEYLDAVDHRGVRINFGAYIGHTAVRLYVLGDEANERAATSEELSAMRRLVADGIRAGALGFATSSNRSHKGPGGRPVASRLGDLAELLALVEPVRDQRRGVIAMLPGEKVQVEDVFVVQRHCGRPLTWTPMLVMRDFPHLRYLEAVQSARRQGQDIWAQTAVRPIVFEENLKNPFTLTRFPALALLTGADETARLTAYQDPDWRARLAQDVASEGTLDWDSVIISRSQTHPDLVGRSVGRLSRQRGTEPSEILLDLAIDDSLETRFSVPVAHGDPEAVAQILQADGVLLGLGDGGAHLGQLCDSCFPTTLLGTWCRERKVLSLEAAVHKLTAEPAGFLGLADRGLIQVGYAADLCVFDPATVDSGPLSRVHDLPGGAERMVANHQSGVRHVIVNGVPIREDGDDVEPHSRPGRVLRSAAPA